MLTLETLATIRGFAEFGNALALGSAMRTLIAVLKASLNQCLLIGGRGMFRHKVNKLLSFFKGEFKEVFEKIADRGRSHITFKNREIIA